MNRDQNTAAGNVSDNRTTDLFEKVSTLLKKDDHLNAIEALDAIINLNPDNLKALSLKADALFHLERYDEAAGYYDKITSIDPTYLDAYLWNDIGSAFFNLGDYEKADAYYDRAINLDPDFAWALRNKGLVQQVHRNYPEAITYYNKAIEANHQYLDPYYDKGTVLLDQGSPDLAIPCFDAVLKLEPENVWAWGMKARALEALENDEEALKCYEKATKINPDDIVTWNDKGNLLYKLDKYEAALVCYNKVIELDPESTYGWSNKALAEVCLGKADELKQTYKKVVEFTERAIVNDPGNLGMWSDLGFAHEYLGNYERSEECFTKLLAIDKDNINALKGLGIIYSEHKYDFVKALEISDRLLELEKEDNIGTRMNHIEDLLKCKRYDQAQKEASETVNKAVTDRDGCLLRFFIFAAHTLLGNTEDADKALTDFFQFYFSRPRNFAIHRSLWIFNGFIKFLSDKSIRLSSGFVLMTLIDLMQGKIKTGDLSFYQASISLQSV